MENNETSEEKKISIKRIFIVTTIIFLLITTLCFGYLYLTEDEDIEDTEKKIDDAEVVCDFNDITRQVTEDTYSRVHFAYESILEPNPNPESPYAACKETLKAKLQNIVDSSDKVNSDSTLKGALDSSIENEHIRYLIDNSFVIYTNTSEIWSVDILDESMDLLWKPSKLSMLEISHLYVITEVNNSRMFFLTNPTGLGGTEEDTKAINNVIKDMCEAGDLGTFVYDTSTEDVEKLYDAEECTEMNL